MSWLTLGMALCIASYKDGTLRQRDPHDGGRRVRCHLPCPDWFLLLLRRHAGESQAEQQVRALGGGFDTASDRMSCHLRCLVPVVRCYTKAM